MVKPTILEGGIAQLFQAVETLQTVMSAVNDLAMALTHAIQQAEIPNLIRASGLTKVLEDGYHITSVDIDPPAFSKANTPGGKKIVVQVTLNILCEKEE